jgi:DNA adenine methylase
MTFLQTLKPLLKWAGGKRQLLPQLRDSLPSEFGCYFEPFVGAVALLFDLQPTRFVISDLNEDLMVCYQALQQDVGGLIARLQGMENTKENYLQIRALDRHPDYKRLPVLDRAARFIYLNRTCFNGLHRVNRQGFFNVAFGGYKNPRICDDWGLVAVHTYLRGPGISFTWIRPTMAHGMSTRPVGLGLPIRKPWPIWLGI